MNTDELAPFALQRVIAYEGMAIDAATWTDAHSYHQHAQRLHTRLLHGWGIVSGLNVIATEPPSSAVVLQPGVAIDYSGNMVRVPEPLHLEITQTDASTMYFALSFHEDPLAPDQDGQTSRVAESFQILKGLPPLPSTYLELARVEVVEAATLIRQARDELAPGPGEIDLRFRRHLRLPVVDTLTIGQLALSNAAANGIHRRGLINVVRELRATAPFIVRFIGDVRAEDAAGVCDLLYVGGAGTWPITAQEKIALAGFLLRGGVVFAEPCIDLEVQRKEEGLFDVAFTQFMKDLKSSPRTADGKSGLEEVGAGHPLLSARYVFGAPPDGLGAHKPLLCRGAAIFNPNDYGCYWQGGAPDKPLTREPIRSAIELACNIAWYAADQARAARVERELPAPAKNTKTAARSASGE